MKVTFNLSKLLHKNQQKIYKKLRRFNVIAAGRRFGKTRLAVLFMFLRAVAQPGVYWWVSPSYPIGTPAWRLMRRLARLVAAVPKEVTRTIEFTNGSIIEFKSADNPDSLRGEGLSGLVMDEVAQIKEEAWTDALRAALADNKGWVIFIGTPKGKNWFYRLYVYAEKKETEEWAAFRYTSYDNPYIDAAEIDAAKDLLPAITFAQEFMADFTTKAGTIYQRPMFEPRTIPAKIISWIISGDTAQSLSAGRSFSAFVVGGLDERYHLHILKVKRERVEFPQLQSRLEGLAEEMMRLHPAATGRIVIEAKSSGLSLVQTMRQTSRPDIAKIITPFTPTTGGVEIEVEDKKNKRKIVAAYNSSVWCDRGMVHLPPPSEANGEWLLPFEEELFDAPNTDYMDQVDGFSQLIFYVQNYLTQGYKAMRPQVAEPVKDGEYGHR